MTVTTDSAPPDAQAAPRTGGEGTGERNHRRSASWLMPVVLPTVAIAVLGFRRRWMSDDGLIFIRPVREILAGNGPVVNAGERVEVASSTLWQWLLALLAFVSRLDPVVVAMHTALRLTVAAAALALAAPRRLLGEHGPLLPAGIFVVLATPPFWDYATSGLDTGLDFAWAAGCWFLLVALLRASHRPTWLRLAFVAGLAPLVRPEL